MDFMVLPFRNQAEWRILALFIISSQGINDPLMTKVASVGNRFHSVLWKSLRVDRHAFDCGVGVEHGFADGGVGVDGEHELVDRAFEFHHSHRFGDELGGLGADDVHAENLAVFCVGNDFYETVVAPDDGGLGVAGERKFADLDLDALLFGLRFGEAD